jgi:hypothetical protein
MKGSGEDRSSRPEDDETHNAPIRVQCPNPACGKTYTMPSSYAGKDGRCICGTVFRIRNATRPPSGDHAWPAPGQDREAVAAGEEDPRATTEVAEVRIGCIGRGQAGKTALLRTLGEGPVGDFFPSGLHVDAGDPRQVAQMIREAEQTQRLLHQLGLSPTLQASQICYYLYDGARPRAAYQMSEVIGQVLTHTLPDSTAELQARYTQYLKSLVNTHVLWAVIPCSPPNPNARDRRRYANDLRITLAYLREALRLRAAEQPVAVALVLSKIDLLFKDAEEARTSLTGEVLRSCFGPLVHLIEQSRGVSNAAIIPVTAFGFGNAVLREERTEAEGTRAESEDEPFAAEPVWLLREGVSAQPANLDTLFIWTLLYGLLEQAGHGVIEEDTELGEICRTLGEDLEAIDAWLLPLKDGITREGRQPLEMPSVR